MSTNLALLATCLTGDNSKSFLWYSEPPPIRTAMWTETVRIGGVSGPGGSITRIEGTRWIAYSFG
jgi:hypothetical protein